MEESIEDEIDILKQFGTIIEVFFIRLSNLHLEWKKASIVLNF